MTTLATTFLGAGGLLMTPPLLSMKVPLLLANVVYTYRGMTPPQAPPEPEEKSKAETKDFMNSRASIQKTAIFASRTVFCGIALAEAAILLAQSQHLPAGLSDRILTLLLPKSLADNQPLQLTFASTVGCILGITGGLLRVWCHRTLGRLFTWEVSLRKDHHLVTNGPYAIVRHPSYTAWFLLIAGNVVLLTSTGSLFAAAGWWKTLAGKIVGGAVIADMSYVSWGLFRRVDKEDAMLRRQFGVEWEEWAQRTPRRLIPFVY